MNARDRVMGYLAQRSASEFSQGNRDKAGEFDTLLTVVADMSDGEYEGECDAARA